jgi:catechol 2,3-dioxygenase-like lactoylglutathione lyase family enzyme
MDDQRNQRHLVELLGLGGGVSMAIRWTHITASVSDFEPAIEFYRDFCGLVLVRDRRKDGGGTVWLGSPVAEEELPTFVLVLGKGNITSRLDHLGFQCDTRDEVDSIAERAATRGILVHKPTDSGGAVGYFTMVHDPDGHLIEFTCGQPITGI